MSNLRSSVTAARKNDEGFTLVELLVVIIVLGILASIVVFGVAKFRTDAQLAACKADVKQVSTAADAYNARNGAYPALGSAANITQLVSDGYLKAEPAAASQLTLTDTTGAVTSAVANCS